MAVRYRWAKCQARRSVARSMPASFRSSGSARRCIRIMSAARTPDRRPAFHGGRGALRMQVIERVAAVAPPNGRLAADRGFEVIASHIRVAITTKRRRGWDLNPRCPKDTTVFETVRFG